MDRKRQLLLGGAIVIGLCNALVARSLLSGSPAPSAEAMAPTPQGPRVLVAQRDLPVGTIVTPDALGFVDWPKGLVGDAYYLDSTTSPAQLAGMVVRVGISAGEPLTRGAVVAPGDRGFLAAALGPGMRAITIPVTDRSSVGGFVFPGDRVDLMLTQTLRASEGAGDQPLAVTETILHDLRVLATDQSAGAETANGRPVVKSYHTVTLEVSPHVAEKIEVAQSIGMLSLSLRALTDSASQGARDTNLDRAMASGAVTMPANASRQEEERLIALATNQSGGGDDTPSFSTGGDVSRFQRRTLPQMRGARTGGPIFSAPEPGANRAATADGGAMNRLPVLRSGPMITVTRGKEISAVPVGGQ